MSGPDQRVVAGGALRVRSGVATHVGRVRDHNEDSVLARGLVFAVADGLGGHAAGEVASRLAVEALTELDELGEARPEDVAHALAEANRRIQEGQGRERGRRGMGTTATGLTLATVEGEERWVVFNIGDSRVYRVAEGGITQVTRDHSEVQELMDAGLIDATEAAHHPLRHVITRSLGSDPAPTPDLWVLPPTAGERFVVCSDGLTGELQDADIQRLVEGHDDPQAAADALVAAAVRAGGHDNVSVVLVAVDAVGP
ncbi:MAG TPA: protein phosphatase 2C domain-containing protein [Ornithinibacter sp.]|nr:protein phosphatase 2C domain-containing protein [Ornithinibacter sp.]